ncbi:MAG TPA: EF-hand domain-containing protein [Burkholderiaceae bacterium]|nr:EF-hand domain-containing protein [Burkholderiaceae bacterium]
MKVMKALIVLLCVFAPFLMAGYALTIVPNGMHALRNTDGIDWLWVILLAAMMIGIYYFLAVYVEDEEKITEAFQRLDRDHDGFITREDAGTWPELLSAFDRFDTDHDGRLSWTDFDAFEHAVPIKAKRTD